MKHIILILLIFVFSIGLGHYWQEDPGYLLLIIHGWQIESSGLFFILLMSLMAILVWLSLRILATVIHIPASIIKLYKAWRHQQENKNIQAAIEAFYQGKTAKALKKLERNANQMPWLVDLIAASAAQTENKLDERDKFIQLASHQQPQALSSILLFQAELQIEKQQYAQAQSMLQKIKLKSPKWYMLQLEIYRQQNLFSQGISLLQQEKQLFTEKPDVFVPYYRHFFKQQFQAFVKKNQIEMAYQLYQARPKCLSNDLGLLVLVAPTFTQDSRYVKPIVKQLKVVYSSHPQHPDLLKLLPLLPETNTWIKLLEQQTPKTAAVFLTLGQLKAKQQLWGAAIHDLEQSIQLQATKEAWSSLSKIYLDLQQTANALKAMQEALLLEG